MSTEPSTPRRYPRVWYEMLFIGFALILGMSLSGAFLAIFAKELNPSSSLIGYVVSAWSLARVFIELPSGFISGSGGDGSSCWASPSPRSARSSAPPQLRFTS